MKEVRLWLSVISLFGKFRTPFRWRLWTYGKLVQAVVFSAGHRVSSSFRSVGGSGSTVKRAAIAAVKFFKGLKRA